MRKLMLLTLAVGILGTALAGPPRHYRFLGPHPVAARLGGGYCYIDAPHFHGYAPDHPALYQQVGDDSVFTGDPTPFGYDGPKYVFYGHHPVAVVGGPAVYCYIDGPHYHPFEPVGPEYKMQGNVAFYVGPLPPSYAEQRPRRVAMVNAEYRPFVSFRPVVDVQPPPEWTGTVYVAPPSVAVSAPGVAVAFPAPSLSVQVQAPGFIVGAPPPPPGVVVGGHGTFVGPPGRREGWHERGYEREHHDNGKHKGWFKH